MHKLLEISGKIDHSNELSESVEHFFKASECPHSAPEIYSSLSGIKASSKNLQLQNFLAALLEAMNAFSQVSDESLKKELIQGTRESVQFYLNRILKEAKEKDERDKIDWVKEFQASLETILQRVSNDNAAPSSSSSSAAAASTSTSTNPPTKSSTNVDKIEGTIKLSGNVWYCEGFNNNRNDASSDIVDVKVEEMQQRLVISKCSNCVIRVSGKCTAISIEQAKGIGVLLQDPVVSTVELLNAAKVQIQLQGACPTMTIDNCEGIQVFLAKGIEKQFELLTCQCTEINLYRASGDAEGEFSAEIPVPVQFKSVFDSEGNLKTEPVKHTGA